MPPESYTTVPISDCLATKLTQIMLQYDCSIYAEAIKYQSITSG